MKPEPSRQFFDKYSNIKFHEIRPMEGELFHADRRMDGYDKAFSNFPNAPKSKCYNCI